MQDEQRIIELIKEERFDILYDIADYQLSVLNNSDMIKQIKI